MKEIVYNTFIAGFGRDLEPKEEKKPRITGRNKFVSYCVSNANRKLFDKILTNKTI